MNERDFDAAVRRYAPAVQAYARAVARDRWAAEDAVQDTFLRAWKYLDSFDNRGSFEGWLIRICRNCVIDQAARCRESEALDTATADAVVQVGFGSGIEIEDLLAHLPVAQREVVVLASVLGYDYESIAALLDVPIGTVRSRLSRGRDALAAMLHRCEVEFA